MLQTAYQKSKFEVVYIGGLTSVAHIGELTCVESLMHVCVGDSRICRPQICSSSEG